jgi:hypothetical protein
VGVTNDKSTIWAKFFTAGAALTRAEALILSPEPIIKSSITTCRYFQYGPHCALIGSQQIAEAVPPAVYP